VLKKTKHAVRKIWDLPVRLLHWMLVSSIAAAWISSHYTGAAHEYIGYFAGLIVVLRVLWGVTGTRYARFKQFIRPAGTVYAYLKQVMRGSAERYLGHNPLGGWMIVALLCCVGSLVLSGWMMTTDDLWGYAWPVQLHLGIAWTLVGLIVLHLCGVVFTSWQHRENLLAAMISGNKKVDKTDDEISTDCVD